MFGEYVGVHTVAMVRSGSDSESGTRSASTETSGASLPTMCINDDSPACTRTWELTIEMRRVNIKAYDRTRRAKADGAPLRLLFACWTPGDGNVPIKRQVMPPRLPSTIQRAIWSELTFQTRCGLREIQTGDRSGIKILDRDWGDGREVSAYLDEEEMRRCSEELVRDVDYLATKCYTREL